MAQEFEEGVDDVVLDGDFEFLEHAKCFVFELHEGVTLAYGSEADACTHDVEGVDVVHSEAVDDLQEMVALEFTLGVEVFQALSLGLFE